MINLKNSGPPLKAEDIQEVEKRLGIDMPEGIVNFYLKSNGGRPERDRFLKDGVMYAIDEFLPIRYGAPNLTLESTLKRVEQIMPSHLIPIAVGPFGDFFCFSLREKEIGSIYILRVDRFRGTESDAEFLASSFDEFLNKLTVK